VFVGRATRGVEFFEHAEKTYETVLRFGITTDTEDTTGKILTQQEVHLTREAVEAVLPRFRGDILQIPPMYSALKVNGQKLYDLARKGREVERQPRPITIHELTLLDCSENEAKLRVRCSKGTYIRTLCMDIGEALGCGGCMAELRRVQAGEYTLEGSVPLHDLLKISEAGEDVEHLLRPVDSMFATTPKLTLSQKQARLVRNGNGFASNAQPGKYRVYSPEGEFLALCKCEDGAISTIKSFFEV
jgi:tRNA pseudouridine55 synthase